MECTDCHSTTSWKDVHAPATFDHGITGYPLLGRHANVRCAGCHATVAFKDLKQECASCHQDQHRAELGPQCENCHSPLGWRAPNDQAAKHQLTRFPLVGPHLAVDCRSCHVNQQIREYAGTPTDCYTCHRKDYESVTTPNHAAQHFDRDCLRCHSLSGTGWTGTWTHPYVAFMSSRAHRNLDCARCHAQTFHGTPTECYGCHQKDYAAVVSPNHVTGSFDHTCTACHDADAWRPAAFDHSRSRFPLTGKHGALECAQCHIDGNTRNMPLDCSGCHQKTFDATTEPAHARVGFSNRCQECHGTAGWVPTIAMPGTIDHAQTRFPLAGAHVPVACDQCHRLGTFRGTPSGCYECHQDSYNRTTNPDHVQGGFSHDCTQCHQVSGWKPATLDHARTAFPLLGAHLTVACASCHVNAVFKGTPTDCYACHRKDFDAVVNPNHASGQFSHDCTICHAMAAWKPAAIDHDKTQFPLRDKHATARCEDCHLNGVYKGTPVDCYSCHQADYQNTLDPNHAAGNLDHDCTRCHSTAGWKPSTFDHAATRFPLTGGHANKRCEQCHVNGQYSNMPVDCWSCHQADFNNVTQPNHTAGQFDHDCTGCHSTASWKPAVFDHAGTRFPLTGKHVSTPCEKCHVNGQFKNLPGDCYDCHQRDFTTVTLPDHVAGQFDHDCAVCHATTAWKPSTFDHATTLFPLTGKHLPLACEKCHINGQYKNMQRDCYACHRTAFDGVVQPNHVQNVFPQDCQPCHSTATWKPSTFSHDATRFPLTGAHRRPDCADCHKAGQYGNLAIDCWSCHQQDFQGVITPNHVNGQFNRDCTICHGPDAWKPSQLDHSRTRFPLDGRHLAARCEDCHINGQYGQTLPLDCYSCHQQTFNQAKNPDHALGQFDHDCGKCHTTAAWKPSTFDHSATAFPLTGAHTPTPCQDCHRNGNYALQYLDCFQCHDSEFASVATPNHVTGQFSHDCATCHSTTAWKPSTFSHAATKFPLSGKHTSTACERCHVNGDYSLQYTECYQCHQQDFTNAAIPNHVASKFDHDCTACHTTIAWKPSTFNHATTAFPLSGAHAAARCDKCHVNGNYQLTYTDCFACHQDRYNAAQQPDHTAGKFDHDCSKCHSAGGWKPAVFDHGTTKLPLTGAHASTPCGSCHVNGNYSLVYTDCYQCHQAKYNSATQPDHVTGKFDHDCSKCHAATAWKPASFNHGSTNFPLTGKHTTTTCDRCHVNGNYTLTYTNCWQCHQPQYNASMNPPHLAAKMSTDCLACHTTNGWRPSTFDHAATKFALAGRHATVPCQNCHVNGNYTLAYTDCWQCHQSAFNTAQSPNHAASQFPHDCLKCHGQNGWKPSTFDHAATAFPLQGAHVSKPCNSCHTNGNYTLSYVDCWQCHQTTFMTAVNPSHTSNQFPHDCLKCHTQATWKPSTFDHAATAFPLQGAHVTKPCNSCHTNGNYALSYVDCWQCHQTTYTNTTNPSHTSNQFPHNCLTCHTQNAWVPSTFSHSATAFPLQGAHVSQACSKCHVGGNYNLSYVDCYQCHQANFNAVSNPNHVSNQFSRDCTTCHTQTAWLPSTFNHGATNFPLQGAHVSQACSRCHVNGNYQLVYSDCYQCHQSDFTGATSPANHVALSLSHNCATCHTQTAWTPASVFRTFHSQNYPTAFPIYTGSRHAYPSRWSNCNQCHTTNNVHAFCCTAACHTNQTSLGNEHGSVSGYTYTCTSCVTCHPDGRAP